jgi:hypothetical protein
MLNGSSTHASINMTCKRLIDRCTLGYCLSPMIEEELKEGLHYWICTREAFQKIGPERD